MKLNIKPIVIGVVVIIIGSVFYFANESAQKVPNVPIHTPVEVFPSGDCPNKNCKG